MTVFGRKPDNADLSYLGLENTANVFWNLTPAELVEETIVNGMGILTHTGALAINTGEFTGRSPKDRFLVSDELTEDNVWWGDINKRFDAAHFDKLLNRLQAYLCNRDVYVKDASICADPKYRLNVRVVSEYPWSNLFVDNMFIRLNNEEIKGFSPDWNVVCAPGFHADPAIDHTRQHNFAIVNFAKQMIIIGGTGYTGEIKKGIFSVLNFVLPYKHNVLPMHCSANVGEDGDTAIFFGLSGTGKTTLSSDPNRRLIGDDEHGWANGSVFNFEGGCYAKCIDLSEDKEPQIFNAIKFGALLENIGFDENDPSKPDYTDSTITENTRVSYPLHHIDNIMVPSVGSDAKNIFFLTCDAYGVLPPISKLSRGQAMYHFMSGYTAKVAGTEAGITDPVTAFSACFGAPFMPLHPSKYAEMLGKKMDENDVRVWLINTGWSGGAYGVGERIKLRYTRAMITAALRGELDNVEYKEHEVFGLHMPLTCPEVPDEMLDPKSTWSDAAAYDAQALKLAEKFIENFRKFEEHTNGEIKSSGPRIKQNA
ncbi:MAG: phosphoenolpyruvate carboxykinase (ATP) [Cryomorphaceae bacterium]|nr:MAG: phosphoenolpyruvate carboxykinase (ATP) [Cryomorphaceae bacterium]